MQRGYLDRSNATAGGKRPLDSSSSEADGQQDRKRPALASVIVEALKVDSLQKLCSSLEPILRRVVSEEVERALAKLGPARLANSTRTSPRRIEGPDGRNLQLHFRTRLSSPIFTGGKVEGEQGTAIHIVLIDANTGLVVTSGLESSVKLDVVVLEGDFNNEDDENWSQEEFESHVVREREGKRPLLTGELQVTLKEGVGTLGELTFTDNSSWIRSRKFRLGLKVSSGCSESIRIREAKTEAFLVRDHRGELYKKHYPPKFSDDVWRLEKIGKDGSFHKRLNSAGISTVEDFLRYLVRDPQRLRNILGSGMSNKMWDALVEHAKTCVLGGKLYVYYTDDPQAQGVGVIFNNIYEFSGLVAGEQFFSSDSLSDGQKLYADTLVKKAYDNWRQVVEYDSKFLNLKQNKNGSLVSQSEVPVQHSPNAFGQQLSSPSLPVEQHSVESAVKTGGYNNSVATRYPIQQQNTNFNGSIQFSTNSLLQAQPTRSLHQVELSTATVNHNVVSANPPEASLAGFQPISTPNFSSYQGLDELVAEELRMRSHEMLEHDDMQHLLRMFSMGGHGAGPAASVNDGYPYASSTYVPSSSFNYNFEEDKGRSGKAVVGWLKLKAALRWGIFIRKKAAERRAQLVELDDT